MSEKLIIEKEIPLFYPLPRFRGKVLRRFCFALLSLQPNLSIATDGPCLAIALLKASGRLRISSFSSAFDPSKDAS